MSQSELASVSVTLYLSRPPNFQPVSFKMTQIFQDALQNSLLSGILKQAKQHLIIDQLLKTHLEKDLQMHCQVAQFQGTTLIVHVSNGMWLTRVNSAIPQLINHLKIYPFLANLEKIQCKVRPFDSIAKKF